MRYVTITKSQFFNNGTGIVPNALDTEKFAPPEDNVITDNDVFWNNFNYYKGAPFKMIPSATSVPYPVGVGILLFGGRRNRIENNRVYGNYLVGIGALQQFLLKQKDAQDLVGNSVRFNQMGMGGADPNGRDLFYDGNGTRQLLLRQRRREVDLPGRRLDVRGVPVHRRQRVQRRRRSSRPSAGRSTPTTRRTGSAGRTWPRPGITPLEHYVAPRRGRARCAAAAGPQRTVEVARLLLLALEAHRQARHDDRRGAGRRAARTRTTSSCSAGRRASSRSSRTSPPRATRSSAG